MATGWTWEYVWEHMTLQRLEVFMRVWKDAPPPNVGLARVTALLKAFMGVKDPTPPGPAPEFASLPEVED